jgi:hypothetical protein
MGDRITNCHWIKEIASKGGTINIAIIGETGTTVKLKTQKRWGAEMECC